MSVLTSPSSSVAPPARTPPPSPIKCTTNNGAAQSEQCGTSGLAFLVTGLLCIISGIVIAVTIVCYYYHRSYHGGAVQQAQPPPPIPIVTEDDDEAAEGRKKREKRGKVKAADVVCVRTPGGDALFVAWPEAYDPYQDMKQGSKAKTGRSIMERSVSHGTSGRSLDTTVSPDSTVHSSAHGGDLSSRSGSFYLDVSASLRGSRSDTFSAAAARAAAASAEAGAAPAPSAPGADSSTSEGDIERGQGCRSRD